MAETQIESQVNCKTTYDQVKFVDKGYLFQVNQPNSFKQ